MSLLTRWSSAFVLALVLASAARADHYVLIVAVDFKAHDAGREDTMVPSAERLEQMFRRGAQRGADKTHVRVLLGWDANRRNTLADLHWLEGMTADDTAFVYLHMHGGNLKTSGFHLAPNGFDLHRLAQTALMGDELRAIMARLAGPCVLCLSSCHSGGIVSKPGAWGKCVLVASCRAGELSKRPIMDQVVSEAFQGKADANGDGDVTIGEFRNYVRQRVTALRPDMHPRIHYNSSLDQVALGRTRSASARLARLH